MVIHHYEVLRLKVKDESVNVGNAKEVGESILREIECKRIEEFVFKKTAQAVSHWICFRTE